jgi:hypothetical protein
MVTVALVQTACADDYDRQRSCAQDAAAFVVTVKQEDKARADFYTNTPSFNGVYDYESKYNGSMGGCFVLLHMTRSFHTENYPYIANLNRLFNVHTRHEIGSLSLTSSADPVANEKMITSDGSKRALVDPKCEFDGIDGGPRIDCGDEAGWKAKIAPYLR